jgi:predicted nucleic acid-binding Zn ribbon protein
VQQSFSDAALTKCPTCQGELVKVFGNVGVTFKGSGFYINDSGSSGSAAGGKKD